ncbi:MAG: NHL repeat-containing protein [Thermincolia bacterium]
MLKKKVTKRTFWLILVLCGLIGFSLPFFYHWLNSKDELVTVLPGALDLRLEGLYYGANNGFNDPIGITVSKEGLVYVADSGNHQIVVLDQKGKEIKRIGGYGTELGKLSYPVSIVIPPGSKKRLIVSELGNSRVQVFDLQGKSLGLFPFQGPAPVSPTAMTMDDQGRLYVVDKASQEILIYTSEGELLSVIGKGLQNGFQYPMGIAIASNEQVIISDSGNGVVKIMDFQGEFLRNAFFKEIGGLFINPRGITLDQYGNLYVAEAIRGFIAVFDQKRQLAGMLHLPEKYTPLYLPDGVAWDGNSLYVVDKGNGRVAKFTRADNHED